MIGIRSIIFTKFRFILTNTFVCRAWTVVDCTDWVHPFVFLVLNIIFVIFIIGDSKSKFKIKVLRFLLVCIIIFRFNSMMQSIIRREGFCKRM